MDFKRPDKAPPTFTNCTGSLHLTGIKTMMVMADKLTRTSMSIGGVNKINVIALWTVNYLAVDRCSSFDVLKYLLSAAIYHFK